MVSEKLSPSFGAGPEHPFCMVCSSKASRSQQDQKVIQYKTALIVFSTLLAVNDVFLELPGYLLWINLTNLRKDFWLYFGGRVKRKTESLKDSGCKLGRPTASSYQGGPGTYFLEIANTFPRGNLH